MAFTGHRGDSWPVTSTGGGGTPSPADTLSSAQVNQLVDDLGRGENLGFIDPAVASPLTSQSDKDYFYNTADNGALYRATATGQDVTAFTKFTLPGDTDGIVIGEAGTYAGLPAVQNDNYAILTADDVGTGTVEAPQYPKGFYKGVAGSWVTQLNILDPVTGGGFRGAFDTAATYNANDLVSSNGGMFQAVLGAAASATEPMDALGTGANQWCWVTGSVSLTSVPTADACGPYQITVDDGSSVRDYYKNDLGAGVYVYTETPPAGSGAANNPATGAPAITGTPAYGQALTADTTSIADADGLGAFTYEWRRDGTAIPGATASTYAVVFEDLGTNITVNVSFTDGAGNAESLTSPATAVPAAHSLVFEVNDAGGSSTPQIVKSGTAPTWEAFENGALAATYAAVAQPSHTFPAGTNHSWRAILLGNDPTAVSQLNINNKNLKGVFPDISALTSLTRINLFDNDVTSIDVTANTALTYLNLGNNMLAGPTLDVSNNTALTYLSVQGSSSLTALDVSALTALGELWLNGSGLTSIDITNNLALRIARFDGRPFGNLDISAHTALQEYYAFGSGRTTIDLTNNTALTRLQLGNNSLTTNATINRREVEVIKYVDTLDNKKIQRINDTKTEFKERFRRNEGVIRDQTMKIDKLDDEMKEIRHHMGWSVSVMRAKVN